MGQSATHTLSNPDQAARVVVLLEERKIQAINAGQAKVTTVPKPEPHKMVAFVLEGRNGESLRAFLTDTGDARLFWDSAGLLIDAYPDRVVDFDHRHSHGDVALHEDAERLIRELEVTTIAPLPPAKSGRI